jgi:hypothetical protein
VRAAVLASFATFTVKFEGRVPCMYADIESIVTTGLGNALFTPEAAQRLPWTVGVGGRPATPEQIAEEWHAVKTDPTLPKAGWKGAMAATHLRLSDDAIDALVRSEAVRMWGILVHGVATASGTQNPGRYPSADFAPADAQLGLLSLAWANGPAFAWPKFQAAFARGDWARYVDVDGVPTLVPGCCAYEGVNNIDAGGFHNTGLIPRNAANRSLFEAAQKVVDEKGNLDTLTRWP